MYVFLENVKALCDSNGEEPTNAEALIRQLMDVGYFVVDSIYDSRLHGSPQRRTRWWGAAIRITEGAPLTTEEVDSLMPQKVQMLQTLARIEMDPAIIEDILLQEDLGRSAKSRLAPSRASRLLLYLLCSIIPSAPLRSRCSRAACSSPGCTTPQERVDSTSSTSPP
eukprot:2419904-Pyramimonas_sp.AAC.1